MNTTKKFRVTVHCVPDDEGRSVSFLAESFGFIEGVRWTGADTESTELGTDYSQFILETDSETLEYLESELDNDERVLSYQTREV